MERAGSLPNQSTGRISPAAIESSPAKKGSSILPNVDPVGIRRLEGRQHHEAKALPKPREIGISGQGRLPHSSKLIANPVFIESATPIVISPTGVWDKIAKRRGLHQGESGEEWSEHFLEIPYPTNVRNGSRPAGPITPAWGDGVDAPRRHLCAKVEVLITT